MDHYACGDITSIEAAEMKHDITIENKEGNELSVDDIFEMLKYWMKMLK